MEINPYVVENLCNELLYTIMYHATAKKGMRNIYSAMV